MSIARCEITNRCPQLSRTCQRIAESVQQVIRECYKELQSIGIMIIGAVACLWLAAAAWTFVAVTSDCMTQLLPNVVQSKCNVTHGPDAVHAEYTWNQYYPMSQPPPWKTPEFPLDPWISLACTCSGTGSIHRFPSGLIVHHTTCDCSSGLVENTLLSLLQIPPVVVATSGIETNISLRHLSVWEQTRLQCLHYPAYTSTVLTNRKDWREDTMGRRSVWEFVGSISSSTTTHTSSIQTCWLDLLISPPEPTLSDPAFLCRHTHWTILISLAIPVVIVGLIFLVVYVFLIDKPCSDFSHNDGNVFAIVGGAVLLAYGLSRSSR